MENEEKFKIDENLLNQSIDALGSIQQGIEASDALQAEDTAFDSQITSEQEDPRNKEGWGLPGVTEELKSAVLGGVQDTASSIQTFPERVIDTLSGEVSRE